MEAVINFLNEYGILSMIITAAVTGLGTALGLLVKKLYKNTIGSKIEVETIKEIAGLVVKYTEQVWTNIHGNEKLDKALEAFSEMLGQKGITISELEMRVYLESALAGFNNAFTKTATTEVTISETIESEAE